MIAGKVILITGGTGSFGRFFTRKLLSLNVKKIIIFSRDEMKQWEMAQEIKDDRVRFLVGDIRDEQRLRRAFNGVDIVVHAAALKIVPIAEYNPFECVMTNIMGGRNVVNSAIDAGVETVVALSTDKASAPINLYGATKLVSDKIFVHGNAYSPPGGTKFAVVRYGNVLGSRGSIIPLFLKQRRAGVVTITDPSMTRFVITLAEGADLVLDAINTSLGGEVFVKKIPSVNVTDFVEVVAPEASVKIIGIRPGEKLHEQMIAPHEGGGIYDCGSHYKVVTEELDDIYRKQGYERAPQNFSYTSDANSEWLSADELKKKIIQAGIEL